MRIEKLGFEEEEYIKEIEKIKNQECCGNLSKEEIFSKVDKLNEVFAEYIDINNVKEESIEINFRALCRVLIDTEKCIKIHNFCHSAEMRELEEVSIMSYYIIRYKPFIFLKEDIEDINERFSLYLILYIIKETNGIKEDKILSMQFFRELLYGLKHYELNKEAIKLIADAIADKFRLN